MSTAVFVVAALLFLMKVLWNLSLPYVLALRAYSAEKAEVRGVSLVPALDVVLLLVATGASTMLDRGGPLRTSSVVLWGGALLVGSYVHMALAGMAAGWLVQVLRGRQQKRPR